MTYDNPPLDQSAIITILKERGLLIGDEKAATLFLEDVSYFRFAAYLRPMEQDVHTHTFKSNATFENALALYTFDEKLRILIFGAIQKIEVSLRARIINQFSISHGAYWFADASLAIDKHKFADNLGVLERELLRTKEDFIKQHYSKYEKTGFPPAWKLLELASFGCLTKLYFNFSNIPVKKRLARSYGVPQHEILESWMKAIGALRNVCAHHGRVWNRIMPVMPMLPRSLRPCWITTDSVSANRLYAVLCCLVYWLDVVDKANTFVRELKSLLACYHNVDTHAMGFPDGWESEPLWR